MSLKYLFTALFQDEMLYEQTEEDVSKTNSLKSAYFDVEEQQNKGNLVKLFTISNEDNVYLVNLDNGSFEVNGALFRPTHKDLTNIRLIYFRRRKELFTFDFENMGSQTIFCLGFQANDVVTGENLQFIMEVE